MKKKILIALIVLMNIIPQVFAFQLQISEEIKNFGIMFIKISLGVVISSIVIGLCLWIYSLFKKKEEVTNPDSKAQQYTCEIDDTKTINEAINTFLTINND